MFYRHCGVAQGGAAGGREAQAGLAQGQLVETPEGGGALLSRGGALQSDQVVVTGTSEGLLTV